MTASASPTSAPDLGRADVPWEPDVKRGFFRYASTHITGLSLPFYVLMVYLFLALSYLDEHLPTLEAMRPRSMLGMFALLVALGRAAQSGIKEGKPLTIRHAPTFWLFAFTFVCTVSALFAFDWAMAKQPHIDHFTALLSYFLLVSIVRTRRELLLTLLVMCAGVGTFLTMSLIEWWGGRYDYAQGVIRMMGIGISNADPNSFGATIVFTLPLVLWAGVYTRTWLVRICAVGYAAMAAYAVLMSSSRSALVLLLLTGVFGMSLLRKGWPRTTGIALLIVGGALMAATLGEAQRKRIASIVSGDTYTRESSTVGRIEGYKVGWRIFTERPLLGVGPGNWSSYRMRRIDGSRLMPHNLTGELLATRGAAGAITFIAYLFTCFTFGVRGWRRRRRGPTHWDRASAALCYTAVFTLFLLLVSGLGAHNLTRINWAWMPALMVIAMTARDDDWDRQRETSV